MKRHAGLHALSQHHHFALIESLAIRKASAKPAAQRQAVLRRLAEKFLGFWNKAGKQHFREEEELLLPAYARHAPIAGDPDVTQMLADHVAIRALVKKLAELLASKQPLENDLEELGERLRAHVRLEEDRIFPRMESLLPEAELNSLGRLLTRLHPKGQCEL